MFVVQGVDTDANSCFSELKPLKTSLINKMIVFEYISVSHHENVDVAGNIPFTSLRNQGIPGQFQDFQILFQSVAKVIISEIIFSLVISSFN